ATTGSRTCSRSARIGAGAGQSLTTPPRRPPNWCSTLPRARPGWRSPSPPVPAPMSWAWTSTSPCSGLGCPSCAGRGCPAGGGWRRPAPVGRCHVGRGALLFPAALCGCPGRAHRRDGPVPAPGRDHGEPGVRRPAAAAVARGLVVLHAAGPARARRPHRRRRLVPGGALPGAEHLGSLPALSAGRAHRRLARGRPDRCGGAADEPGGRPGHVGRQGGGRGCRGGGSGLGSPRQDRPAFYAVGRGRGGPGDWLPLLPPPYTLWHLSYVVMGAAVMPPLVVWRLAGTLVAFFLAVGIGAHALDELKGRALGTGIGSTVLAVTAGGSIAGR